MNSIFSVFMIPEVLDFGDANAIKLFLFLQSTPHSYYLWNPLMSFAHWYTKLEFCGILTVICHVFIWDAWMFVFMLPEK